MRRRDAFTRLLGAALLAGASPRFRQSAYGQEGDTLPWTDISRPLAPGVRPGIKYFDLSQLRTWIVRNEDFFVLHHHHVPALEIASFRLAIEGQVERPLALSLAELQSRPQTELAVAVECAGNGRFGMHGLVGNARWGGVPLAPLLREARLRPEAREVVFYGADGAFERLRGERYPARFARSLSLTEALAGDALLAYEMNGQPLPPEHGSPLRLVVPGWYGVAHVKWLERIEVVDRPFMGWFMAKDYVTLRGRPGGQGDEFVATSVGRARLKSIVTRVTRRAGEILIHGAAWNDGTRLRSVEVRIDDGPFRAAELEPPESRYGWTFFRLPWTDASPGPHRLVSRAADELSIQPTEEEVSARRVTPWENFGQVVRELAID